MKQAIVPLYYLMPEGMTQDEISNKANISCFVVSRCLTGKDIVSNRTSPCLSAALNVDEDYCLRCSLLTVELANKGLILKGGKVANLEAVKQPYEKLNELRDSSVAPQTLAELWETRGVSTDNVMRSTGWSPEALLKYKRGEQELPRETILALSQLMGCLPLDVINSDLYTRDLAKSKLLKPNGFPKNDCVSL